MDKTILKSDLIKYLAHEFPDLPEELIVEKTNEIIEHMIETLAKNDRIEIRGFGSFSMHLQPARRAHNPRTGEKVDTPEKFRPHFKPGKDLRKWVNEGKISDIEES